MRYTFDRYEARQYEQGRVKPHRDDYLLWFGPMSDARVHGVNDAMSPAADRWQRRLIDAVRAQGVDVEVVSYTMAAAWPRGALKLPRVLPDTQSGPVEQLGYHNLPYWRALALTNKRIAAGLARRKRRGRPPLAIITYNAHPNVTLPAVALRRLMRTPWLCVVADIHDRRENMLGTAEWLALDGADGRVYLSAAMGTQLSGANDVHIEGGIEPPLPATPTQPALAVYAGALTPGAGVDLAVAAFAHVHRSNARLEIYGKGDDERVRKLAENDPFIIVHGLVAKEVLACALEKASVFLNPRLPSLPENRRNFPSKLLEYLAYGKPIVSTWTDGLTEDYRKVLHVADATPEAFGAAIETCFTMNDEALAALRARMTEFATIRSWSAQAQRLLTAVRRASDTPR